MVSITPHAHAYFDDATRFSLMDSGYFASDFENKKEGRGGWFGGVIDAKKLGSRIWIQVLI
jgi:hypothetical protein